MPRAGTRVYRGVKNYSQVFKVLEFFNIFNEFIYQLHVLLIFGNSEGKLRNPPVPIRCYCLLPKLNHIHFQIIRFNDISAILMIYKIKLTLITTLKYMHI